MRNEFISLPDGEYLKVDLAQVDAHIDRIADQQQMLNRFIEELANLDIETHSIKQLENLLAADIPALSRKIVQEREPVPAGWDEEKVFEMLEYPDTSQAEQMQSVCPKSLRGFSFRNGRVQVLIDRDLIKKQLGRTITAKQKEAFDDFQMLCDILNKYRGLNRNLDNENMTRISTRNGKLERVVNEAVILKFL